MSVHTSSEADLDEFTALCARLSAFDAEANPELVDGYLTAFAVAPVTPPLALQLEMVFGDVFARCFADPLDAATATAVFAKRQQVLTHQLDAETLLDAPDQLRMQPFMQSWDDESRAEAIATGELDEEQRKLLLDGSMWAAGFLDAIDVLQSMEGFWDLPSSDEALAVYDELMSHVQALCIPDGDPDMAEHLARFYPPQPGTEPPTRDELIDQACGAIQDLRVWWLSYGPKPEPRIAPAKLGRNDPCYCGSGKKFKKCHGA